MGRKLRLILAVVAGVIVGSIVNMGLILISGVIIPPPAGADVTTAEGLRESLHLFQPRHFIFPFLAHALGTLVGAVVATRLTPERRPGPAYVVAGVFLVGGIANVIMLPVPTWFSVVDLTLAYLPAAWLGHRLASRRRTTTIA